jgi:hypothetical protein
MTMAFRWKLTARLVSLPVTLLSFVLRQSAQLSFIPLSVWIVASVVFVCVWWVAVGKAFDWMGRNDPEVLRRLHDRA